MRSSRCGWTLLWCLSTACNTRELPDDEASTGMRDAVGDDSSSSTDASSSTDSTGSSSLGSSSGGDEAVCEPHTYFQCTHPVPTCDDAPLDPAGCGTNKSFDHSGCGRRRCRADEDCAATEVCRDLVPCVAPACVRDYDFCDDDLGDDICWCRAVGACATDMKLCFGPGEFTC